MSIRFPAEWEPQDGVMLAWPHANTDWAPCLDLVEPVFVQIAREVSRREHVLIVTPDPVKVQTALLGTDVVMERIHIVDIPTNDTWTRDYGPITVIDSGRPVLLDFGFNGWGLKFAANLDNLATRRLHSAGIFGTLVCRTIGLIFEGGSIESDGCGTLLTTRECLLSPNRNPHLNRQEIERELSNHLGANHLLWLENGYLAGDDTDAHIDTLARLCPNDTIVFVSCDDAGDEHYAVLRHLRDELRAFRTREGKSFRLLPLPWPQAIFDANGERLAATYANFLVINGAVLVPTYRDPSDQQALDVVGKAFPDRAMIGIDCLPLILQHGSLHCVTMQLPKGVLACAN